MKGRRLTALVLTTLAVVAVPGVALASWVGAGSGSAYGVAFDMPTGSIPTVSAAGRTVSITWPEARFPDSTAVNAYLVTRYDTGGIAQTVGAGCDGAITALTCDEGAVPPGTWTYAVAAKHGDWTGAEGAPSVPVIVDPASLTFSSSTTISSLPNTLSGNVSSFLPGETLTFRLDDPTSGAILADLVTPSPIPASGSSSITVTIPALVSAGAHTVYAVGSLGSQAGASVDVLPHDTTAPTVASSVIAKSAGGVGGFIKQGGQYYVYANVTDAGSPASGVSTVRANASAISLGAANLILTAGAYSVEGVAFNYRSAIQTVMNPLAAGTKNYTITATDVSGNATTPSFAVIVDNTAPSGADVQTTNVGGGTGGKAETGDTISLTYSEPMDPYSMLSGWNGSPTTVVLRLVQNGGGDRVRIYDAANTSLLPLGTVQLNRTDYTTSTVMFLNSSMVRSGSTVTVTLGTPGGPTTTAAGTGTMTWAPSAAATDYAANACATTTRTETGTVDSDF